MYTIYSRKNFQLVYMLSTLILYYIISGNTKTVLHISQYLNYAVVVDHFLFLLHSIYIESIPH